MLCVPILTEAAVHAYLIPASARSTQREACLSSEVCVLSIRWSFLSDPEESPVRHLKQSFMNFKKVKLYGPHDSKLGIPRPHFSLLMESVK